MEELNIDLLLDIYKYRIELHSHSFPASQCSRISPEELVRLCAEAGYDAVTLTNHLYSFMQQEGECAEKTIERYADDYRRACAEGEHLGIQVYFGIEIRFDDCANDYLVYGADEKTAADILTYLSRGLSELRASYHNDDMLIIQAHPGRDGMIYADPSLIDGIEVINLLSEQKTRNSIAAAFGRDVNKVLTAGSDLHFAGTHGNGGIYTKILPRNSAELASLLRSGDYLLNMSGLPVIPRYVIKGCM